jgi:hypothetical protein
MAYNTWYSVNDSLEMYDTGTGWEYSLRKHSVTGKYYVIERRKSGNMETRRSGECRTRATAKILAMQWAMARL